MGNRRGRPTHGESGTPLYRAWKAMKNRVSCSEAYAHVQVCEDWLTYEEFRDWAMSSGYSEGMSLDRIDNNLGYMPDNCRWVHPSLQSGNRRTNRMITAFGKTQTAAAWSRELGIKENTIYARLKAGRRGESALDSDMRPGVKYKGKADEAQD